VSNISEEENHHPDLKFGWGYAEVNIFTHKINGLTLSDFILASKIDLCS
jgi:4a-hydroxytetrahydrobiopterin dehydratase